MLGKKAKDKTTGFTGIVSAKAEYLGGYNSVLISARVNKEGKVEEKWIDINNIVIIAGKKK